MAEFKLPKHLAYLLEDSTNKTNIAKLKDELQDYIRKNVAKGTVLKSRQGVPGLPELIKFNDGKGVKLTGVSSSFNKGKRLGFSYTDLEGSNIREDMLTLMTDESGAAKSTRYGKVARGLPKGFEDHHRRFRTLFQPFYEGLSDADAKELTKWFVSQRAPLGNVIENLEGIDEDLHRKFDSSIHSWARENNIQVSPSKPGDKNFYLSDDGKTVAVKGGASNIEGVKGPDGKLKFIPDNRPPVVTGKAFGAATRSTFPSLAHLPLNQRLGPASDFLKYVDEPLQDYTAGVLHKQDIIRYGEKSPKVRSVDQIKDHFYNLEENAGARMDLLEDNPNLKASDLDSADPIDPKRLQAINADRPGGKVNVDADKIAMSKQLQLQSLGVKNWAKWSKAASGIGGAEAAVMLAGGQVIPGSIGLAMQSPLVQKQIGKLMAKQGIKLIPGMSLASGVLQGAGYLASGQFGKAGLSVAGGVIGEAGPAGDAVQAMIDLGLTTHDIKTAKAKPKTDTDVVDPTIKKPKPKSNLLKKVSKAGSNLF